MGTLDAERARLGTRGGTTIGPDNGAAPPHMTKQPLRHAYSGVRSQIGPDNGAATPHMTKQPLFCVMHAQE